MSQANGNTANNTRGYGIDALPQQPQTLHCCRIPRLLAESALVHAPNVNNRNPRNGLHCATHMRIMSAKWGLIGAIYLQEELCDGDTRLRKMQKHEPVVDALFTGRASDCYSRSQRKQRQAGDRRCCNHRALQTLRARIILKMEAPTSCAAARCPALPLHTPAGGGGGISDDGLHSSARATCSVVTVFQRLSVIDFDPFFGR
jgi:hypothetical protein